MHRGIPIRGASREVNQLSFLGVKGQAFVSGPVCDLLDILCENLNVLFEGITRCKEGYIICVSESRPPSVSASQKEERLYKEHEKDGRDWGALGDSRWDLKRRPCLFVKT